MVSSLGLYTHEMTSLDQISKHVRELERTQQRLGRDLAEIKGRVTATQRLPHFWVTPMIAVLGTAFMGFQSWIAATLVQDVKTLAKIQQSLSSIGLSVASATPTSPKSQEDTKDLLAQARRGAIPAIPTSTIEQAGNQFMSVSATNAGAWAVLLDLAAYRSSFNEAPSKASAQSSDEKVHIAYRWRKLPDKPEMALWAGPAVPAAFAARFQYLGAPVETDNARLGNAFLIGMGGAADITGTYMRHVYLENVEVHYAGGPLVLDDVTFISCTFVFDNSPKARTLAQRILSQRRVAIDLS